jgi:hypothetical protein
LGGLFRLRTKEIDPQTIFQIFSSLSLISKRLVS